MALSKSEELARALGVAAHPLRLDLLDAFNRGLARTVADAATALGQGLPNTRHHIRVLERNGLLARAGEGPAQTLEPTARARTLVEALTALT
jgi:DNA-binding IclR family transcriptional regulator